MTNLRLGLIYRPGFKHSTTELNEWTVLLFDEIIAALGRINYKNLSQKNLNKGAYGEVVDVVIFLESLITGQVHTIDGRKRLYKLYADIMVDHLKNKQGLVDFSEMLRRYKDFPSLLERECPGCIEKLDTTEITFTKRKSFFFDE